MPEVGEKMRSHITKNNVICSKFCAISSPPPPPPKKKVIARGDCQEFSFLYRRTLKQMKLKRSSGYVPIVHLFLRLSVLLQSASSFEETAPLLRRMKKKWRCAGRYSQTKTP